jgi:universal stress protein E
LGNTDWHLIRECPLPLLLAKPAGWRQPLVVAAAIDPPANALQEDFLDQRIVECAVSIGRSMHAKVLAVHAYFPEIVEAAATLSPPNIFSVTPEMIEAERVRRQQAIASFLAPYQLAPEFLCLDMGVPTAYLPEIAAERAIDLMVMGALSRSHLKQALIGSTAERLLEYLPCDVLVVKETRFADYLPTT